MKNLIIRTSVCFLGCMLVVAAPCGVAAAQSLDGQLGEYSGGPNWAKADRTPGDECPGHSPLGPVAGPNGFGDFPSNSALNVGRVCFANYNNVRNPDGSIGALFIALELSPSQGGRPIPFDSDGDGDPTNERGIEYYRVIVDLNSNLDDRDLGRCREVPCSSCEADPNQCGPGECPSHEIPFTQEMDSNHPERDPSTGALLMGRGEYDFVLVSARGHVPDPDVPPTSGDPTGLHVLRGGGVSFSLGQQVAGRDFTTGHVEFRIQVRLNTDAVRLLVIAESKGDRQPADIAGGEFVFAGPGYAFLGCTQTADPGRDLNTDGRIDDTDACLALAASRAMGCQTPGIDYGDPLQSLEGSSVFLHSSICNISTNSGDTGYVSMSLNAVPDSDGSCADITNATDQFSLVSGATKTPWMSDGDRLFAGEELVLDRVCTFSRSTESFLNLIATQGNPSVPTGPAHSPFDSARIDIVRPAVDLSILVDDDPVFDEPSDPTPPSQQLSLQSRMLPLELTFFFVVTNIGETTLTELSLISTLPVRLGLHGSKDLHPGQTLVRQRSITIAEPSDCDHLDSEDGARDGHIGVRAEVQSHVKIDELGRPSHLGLDGMPVPTYRQSVRSSAGVYCACPEVVTFDTNALGVPIGAVTDVSGRVLEDLGIRIQGVSGSNGSAGVFTILRGPAGSDTDDLIPVSGNFISTLADPSLPQESDYGTLCIDFVDPLTLEVAPVCYAQLTFLDAESSIGQLIAYSEPGCGGHVVDVGTTLDNGTEDNADDGNHDVVTVGESGSTLAIASVQVRFGSPFDSAAVDHLCFERMNSGLVATTHAKDDVMRIGGEASPLLFFVRNVGATDFDGYVLPYAVFSPRSPVESETWFGEPVSIEVPAGGIRTRRLEARMPTSISNVHVGRRVRLGHILCDRDHRVMDETRVLLLLGADEHR